MYSKQPSSVAGALSQIHSLSALFAWRAERTPHAVAYRQYDRAGGRWRSHTWKEMQLRTQDWQRALGALMLGPAARGAILLPNCIDAVCADQAALSLGLVPVPLHTLDNFASVRYILDDCQASLLLTATIEQWQAIAAAGTPPTHLRLVVTLRDGTMQPARPSPAVISLSAWLAAPTAVWRVPPAAHGSDLAAILYTTGAVGKPRGVMLTHANILANLGAVHARVPVASGDVFLSVLPLSHAMERTLGYYLPLAAGATVAYARSAAQLGDDLAMIRPTVLVGMPALYERLHTVLRGRWTDAGGAMRRLSDWTLRVGWRRFRRRRDGTDVGLAELLDILSWPLLDLLCARSARNVFGGRLRAAISGGAALGAGTAHDLLALGIPLLQGYGMTECAPVVACNGIEDNDPDSAGLPVAGTEVRVGARDELQVHSASVSPGYWGRPEDTASALDADGWFHTGDRAVLERGRVRVFGRLQDMIMTSSGQQLAAAEVEQALLTDPLFTQAMVGGDHRPHPYAVVVLEASAWRMLALRLALNPRLSASLDAPALHAVLRKRVADACAQLPGGATPRTLLAVLDPWSVENGLLAPTGKLKRAALAARYAARIDALYRVDDAAGQPAAEAPI